MAVKMKGIAFLICLTFLLSATLALFVTDVADARTGGPDAYGYMFTDSTEPGGVEYEWIDISGTGNSAWAPGDTNDDGHVWVADADGFVFNFYGNTYTGMAVSSNGAIRFSSTSISHTNYALPRTVGGDDRFIASFWDDMFLRADSRVYWEVLGDAPNRYLVVTFYNFGRWNSAARGTWQNIFIENSETMVFQYQDMTQHFSGGSATVGIQDSLTHYLQYSFNEAVINDGLAITFYTGVGHGIIPWSYFRDDMEGDVSEWNADGLWHIAEDGVTNYPESHTPVRSWWYGQEATGNYDTGAVNSGRLTTPELSIGPNFVMDFWEWYHTEGGTTWDYREVQIFRGGVWEVILRLPDDGMQTWRHRRINLSPYDGEIVRLGFYFNTVDGIFNNFRGWYVDDVFIGTPVTYDVVAVPPIIDIQADSGTSVDYVYEVTNTGGHVDTYDLSHTALPVGWGIAFLDGGVPVTMLKAVRPGEIRTFTAVITIPAGEGPIEQTTEITATSRADPGVSVTVDAVTRTLGYDFEVTPLESELENDVGTSVDHVFTITNTGSIDVYDITIAGNAWATQIFDAAGINPIASLGPISGSDTMDFIVRVFIPVDAEPTDIDEADITVTSQNDGTVSDIVVARTLVSDEVLYLETTFVSNNGQTGNMFDVEIKNSLVITALAVNVGNPGAAVTIELYIKDDTHVGFEQDPGAWELAATGTGTSQGGDSPTYIDIDDVHMQVGSYGFYVRVAAGPNLWYTNGAQVYENDDMKITSGTGNMGLFGTVFSPRIWNGRIYYRLWEEGVYFVSTHTADAGWSWGWENGRIIDNSLDWLWPTYANSGDILLVWDNGAWGNSWKNALTGRGIPWTERTGQALTAANLDPNVYSMVIITEFMNTASLNNMEALVPELEAYVRSGGVLVDMIATNNVRRWSRGVPGPFGVETNSIGGAWSYLVEPDHPMLAGMTPPTISGGWDVHGQITVPPAGSTTLLSYGAAPGGLPTACWLSTAAGPLPPHPGHDLEPGEGAEDSSTTEPGAPDAPDTTQTPVQEEPGEQESSEQEEQKASDAQESPEVEDQGSPVEEEAPIAETATSPSIPAANTSPAADAPDSPAPSAPGVEEDDKLSTLFRVERTDITGGTCFAGLIALVILLIIALLFWNEKRRRD